MAVILAESVAITKSRLAKGFNGDNLNLNGKIISTQEADSGFKAAGSVRPPYIAVIASGNQKGFAAGAVSAFNDYVKDINLNKYNAEAVIGRYFDDMQSVVEKCDIDGSRLSVGIVCAYDDCVVAAKTGDCHILRFSEGELFEIALSDDEGGRGYQFIDVVADGDMFALVGEEASADLDYDGIVNAFDTDADLKTIIKDFYKLLSARASGKDCSVILMKLKSDAERTYAATPLVVSDEEINSEEDSAISVSPESFETEPPVDADELREANVYVADDETPETGKKPTESTKKKILNFIPIAVLIIILAITAALFLATRSGSPLSEGESGSGDGAGNQIVFNNDENMNGDFNGSNGMQNVEDTEFGGEVVAPEVDDDDETTTKTPETTTRQPEPTRAPESTTNGSETSTNNTTESTDPSTDNTTESTETTETTETTEDSGDTPVDTPPEADEPEDGPADGEPVGGEEV